MSLRMFVTICAAFIGAVLLLGVLLQFSTNAEHRAIGREYTSPDFWTHLIAAVLILGGFVAVSIAMEAGQ